MEAPGEHHSIEVAAHGRVAKEPPPATPTIAIEQRESDPRDAKLFRPQYSAGGLAEFPKSQALEELQDVGIRGGGMILLRTMVLDLEGRLKIAEDARDQWREQYEKEHVRAEILEIQLAESRKTKILQNVMITAGGILNSFAVNLIADKQNTNVIAAGGLLFAIGITLILAGWILPFSGKRKK
jgi:hypothetical protein